MSGRPFKPSKPSSKLSKPSFSWFFAQITERIYRWALPPLALFVNRAFPGLKRRFKRASYDWFSSALGQLGVDGIHLLNYGYAYADGLALPLDLDAKDRQEYLFSWNLVYETARPARVAGKKVLVIGCGRGGDAYFIRRYLNAASVVGIDLSRAGIDACRRDYSMPGLEFGVGDAERLQFPDEAFDAVISIESSHGYGDLGVFYRQVSRVLKPGGIFLYCDYFRDQSFRRQLSAASLKVLEEADITEGVLRACRDGQAARETRILRHAPSALHGMLREWCAFPGSTMYRALEQRACRYHRFVLMKGV